jgi:hypothetical protein
MAKSGYADELGLTLIHGCVHRGYTIASDAPHYPHAWIELGDGRFYDPVFDSYFEAEKFIARYDAVILFRYNKAEAMRISIEHGHCGPWEIHDVHRDVCVATAYGEPWCRGRCVEPKDCTASPRPKPYSRGCLAREVPGATCQAPNCDC